MMTLLKRTKNKPKANQFLVAASSVAQYGPRTLLKILSKLSGVDMTSLAESLEKLDEGFFEHVLKKSSQELALQIGVELGNALHTALADTKSYEKIITECEEHDITLLTFCDDEYPSLLRHIHAPPMVLYVAGTLPQEAPSLAIVGSRKAGIYARDVLQEIIPPLVSVGIPIISGGAYGVDAKAHTLTVAQGGKTVVVLGSGLLNPYPKNHKSLFESVVATGGAVISPFSLHEEPIKGNFPARNRIIAGMTNATLVVQAAEESGALITAQYALDEGRAVMAVPGPITDPLSAGCHKLIAQGARLVTSAHDVANELGVPGTDKYAPHYQGAQSPLLKLLDKPTTIDELMTITGSSFGDVQEQLFDLQLEGKTEQPADRKSVV